MVILLLMGTLTGCRQVVKPGRIVPRLPSSYLAPDTLLCDFVPKTVVSDVLGFDSFVTNGSISGPAAYADGVCAIRLEAGGPPLIEVDVNSPYRGRERVNDLKANLADPQWSPNQGYPPEDQLAGPRDQWFVYPADVGVGYSYPWGYSLRDRAADPQTERRDGAISELVRGDDHLVVHVFRPRRGGNAVTDSVTVTRAIIAAFDFPLAPSQPYPTP